MVPRENRKHMTAVDLAASSKRKRPGLVACLLPLLALAACATPPTEPAARAQFEANNDPLEPLNRQIFSFNMFLDKWLMKPVSQAYQDVVPDPGKEAMRNFLANLHEPVIFANNVLQTEFKRAAWTAERFALNSTIGVGGVFDVATRWGVEKQSGDFGQTLYHYGMPDGPYLVLPLLGPSNPRDTVGLVADGYADPFGYLAYDYGADVATYARMGGEGLDQRAQNIQTLNDLQRNAIDLYAELRSLYRQHRASELRHGAPAATPAEMEDLYRDPDKAPGPGAPTSPGAPAATPSPSR
jgi:phospholipid-binding lipoprotein MlaA